MLLPSDIWTLISVIFIFDIHSLMAKYGSGCRGKVIISPLTSHGNQIFLYSSDKLNN
jgi:hypothetical protein